MAYYVYIMSNDSRTLYIGVTNDIVRRVYEHKQGSVEGFSKKYHCHKLVFLEETHDVYTAIAREKQLKNWRREKKEFLINQHNPNWNDLMHA